MEMAQLRTSPRLTPNPFLRVEMNIPALISMPAERVGQLPLGAKACTGQGPSGLSSDLSLEPARKTGSNEQLRKSHC